MLFSLMRIEILEIKRNILLCDYLEVKHDLVNYCFYVFNFLSLSLFFFPLWSNSMNMCIHFEIIITVLNLHNSSCNMGIRLEWLIIFQKFYVFMIKGPHLHTMGRFYIYKETKVISWTKNIHLAPVQSSISLHNTHCNLEWLCSTSSCITFPTQESESCLPIFVRVMFCLHILL